jgi:hypothetical protein
MTHDIYASLTGRTDPAHLLRVGRAFSLLWGLGLIGGALAFHWGTAGTGTPAVVLALSIASVTYGALLGAYVLAGGAGTRGSDVLAGVGTTVTVMLVVLFAGRLAAAWHGLAWLAPLGRLAWPWYVPLGTAICVATGSLASRRR